MIDCPGVVYPQGDSETMLILKGVVRVENVKDPENHVQGVLDRIKAEHLKRTYMIDDWTDVEDFLAKVATKSGRLLKKGEPDICAAAKMVLNDFQRAKLPYFVRPPGCEMDPRTKDDQPPINETTEDAKAAETDDDERSTVANDDDDDGASLTDVDSNCSGLTDLSGVSDLEMEDIVNDDDGKQRKGKASNAVLPIERRRKRGRRAGKKLNREKVQRTDLWSNDDDGSNTKSTTIDFTSKCELPNSWRRKLAKRRKPKHQS